MSEFLIHPKDNLVADLSKMFTGCYRKGYFVDEREDGFFDEYKHLYVLKVPEKKVGAGGSDKLIRAAVEDDGTVVRRRKYSLSSSEFDKLFASGTRATLTIAAFALLVADDTKIVNLEPLKKSMLEIA